ncbi:MAG: 4-hydroxybenzoate transporter [Hyphomicrobiales bacterium]|nr:4-hydroxybenzoate transporter [Hyphomicrobiales bacterium]
MSVDAAGTLIDVPQWIDQQKLSSLQILVAVICGVAVMIDGFDAQIIGFVAPAVIGEFKVQPQMLAGVFSAGLFGILIGCLFLAPIADWVGRRSIMITSVLVFALATLATAWVNDLDQLMTLRFLTGIGLGACMPNALALTSEYAPMRMRGRITAWMFTGFSVGAFAGGVLAAQIIPAYGWRSMFIVGGILPLLLCLVMVFALPESVRHLAAKKAAPVHIAAILKRIYPDPQLTRDTRFMISEEHARGFTLPHLFKQGRATGTVLLWVMFFLMLFDVFLLASWTPTVLIGAGLSREQAVYAGAAQQAGSVMATILLGPLFDRIGFYRTLVPLLLASAIGVIVMGAAGTNLAVTDTAAFLAGAGVMGGQTTLIVLAGAFYPTFIRATGVGWGLGIGRTGAIVGPLVGGAMLASQWRPEQIFQLAAIPPVIVACLLLVMSRLTRAKRRACVLALMNSGSEP